ncbi:MAG: oligopeptidase B [Candidatus Krumholzibacteriia bacterium]|jgi:oligopeptidase B
MNMFLENFSRAKAVLVMSVIFGAIGGCGEDAPAPPVADIRPHEMSIHGDSRIDNYYWLNEREDSAVLAYLNSENEYLNAVMKGTESLQQTLMSEIKGRIKKDDASAPYLDNGYWYYKRYVEGGEYAVHCRRKGKMESSEEIMLDGNSMGAGDGYFAIKGATVSPDTENLIYGVDTAGRRLYTLHFKNLKTGLLASETIPGATGNVAWASDNKTIFYAMQDEETLRSYQIWRHEIGTDQASDKLIYEEQDDTFSCYVSRSKSGAYLFISSYHTLSSEVRMLKADNPTGDFEVFQARMADVEYDIAHQGDRFVIHTNLQAKNFRLMECGLKSTGSESWRELLAHRDDVLIEDVDVFADWLVISERFDGLTHLSVRPNDGGEGHYMAFDEPTWTVWTSQNRVMNTATLRFGYDSLTTPETFYSYDMATKTKVVIKQDEVVGDFDANNYVAEYLHVPARDGVLVPVSLVYRKGLTLDGSAPLLLYAYGSYGSSVDASFSAARLSLLDRGFVYAIAHIRGGQEMGRQWYEDGKLLKKINTFTDFIDCGQYLVDNKYTASERLYAYGGSAGGLLMGAVANMAPELWDGVIAAVPFVDVVTTMLDDTIPLTTGEYDEWGNPNVKEYYDYMLSYSPYDQVTVQDYPALLVTTGLHDSQVQYFEPAKWVAKLRAVKTDKNPLLFKINMEAGHGGKSGRFRRLEETALVYAFMIDLANR